MNKVAYYEEMIMEKIATRAWKKHLGDLSEASQKKLVDSGIHNYKKELQGLEKGTKEILKKNSATVSRNPITRGVATVRQVSSERGIKNKWRSILENTVGSKRGPAGITIPNITDPKQGKINVKYHGTDHTKGLNKTFRTLKYLTAISNPVEYDIAKESASDVKRARKSLTNFEKKYVNAIIERHEADEVRAMKEKGNTLEDWGWSKEWSDHASKTVPYRESANVAVAPKGVQDYMNAVRSGTGEILKLKARGFKYGKDAVVSKKSIR